MVIIERSLDNWKLKTPISIDLNKILAAGEKGLVDYIIRSCIREQPALIPYIFENKTLLKLARHFLRDCQNSYSSCRNYTAGVKKYAKWLGKYIPTQIIDDVKPVGAIPDPLRVQNHCGFLNDYLADFKTQDSPGAISNRLKAAKTFYHVNGAKKVEIDLQTLVEKPKQRRRT